MSDLRELISKAIPDGGELKTVDELAGVLKVNKSWIYDKTRETGPDAIPRIKVGKYIRFYLPAVFEWLMQREAA